MNISHDSNTHKGTFIIDDKAVSLSMNYGFAETEQTIDDNTNITEDFRSKGIENQLLTAVILHARKHEMKIVPLCTFTKSIFANEHDVMID